MPRRLTRPQTPGLLHLNERIMRGNMQIGFNLPVSGPMAAPEVMANIAQLGEVPRL